MHWKSPIGQTRGQNWSTTLRIERRSPAISSISEILYQFALAASSPAVGSPFADTRYANETTCPLGSLFGLPLTHSSNRHETLPTRISHDDSRRFVFWRLTKFCHRIFEPVPNENWQVMKPVSLPYPKTSGICRVTYPSKRLHPTLSTGLQFRWRIWSSQFKIHIQCTQTFEAV